MTANISFNGFPETCSGKNAIVLGVCALFIAANMVNLYYHNVLRSPWGLRDSIEPEKYSTGTTASRRPEQQPKTNDRKPKTETTTENKRPKTNDRKPKTENQRPKTNESHCKPTTENDTIGWPKTTNERNSTGGNIFTFSNINQHCGSENGLLGTAKMHQSCLNFLKSTLDREEDFSKLPSPTILFHTTFYGDKLAKGYLLSLYSVLATQNRPRLIIWYTGDPNRRLDLPHDLCCHVTVKQVTVDLVAEVEKEIPEVTELPKVLRSLRGSMGAADLIRDGF